MKTIANVGEAEPCVLDILSRGPISAGNITRKMMGAGLLPKVEASYALIAVTLAALGARGLVTKSGNGKSVHWRLGETLAARLAEAERTNPEVRRAAEKLDAVTADLTRKP